MIIAKGRIFQSRGNLLMSEGAKRMEETQDAGDTLGKTREALSFVCKAQAGDLVQLRMQAGRMEIRLKEFSDVRGIRACNCWRREIPSHSPQCAWPDWTSSFRPSLLLSGSVWVWIAFSLGP